MGAETNIFEFILTTNLLLAALAGGMYIGWKSLLRDYSSFYSVKRDSPKV